MARPKKQKDNPEPKKESELYGILWDLHNHVDKVNNLVGYLEKVPENSYSRDFCKSYTILLFQKYINGDNAEDAKELMLVACNFLKGFNDKNLDDRMQRYRQYIKGYNSLIKESWSISTYSTKYRGLLKDIVDNLELKLHKAMEQNNGKLGLIADVSKKLEFPAPRSIPSNAHYAKQNIPPEEIIIGTSNSYRTEEGKISVKISFPNGGNVDIKEASASKPVLGMILDIAKLAATFILLITCSIRLYMNVVDHQASEKINNEGYVGEIHDNLGDYQPNKFADKYQSNADWNPNATPYDGETNQESVEEYAETTSTKISLNQFLLLDIDLYLEDMDRKIGVEVINLGEDE